MVLLTSGGFEDIWRRHRAELEGRIGGRIADSAIETSSYSTNAGNFEIAPVAVITPEGDGDVSEVVRFCRKYGMPLTARGSGSSVTDAALGRGIVLDFSRKMSGILALDVTNGLVRAGAGITLESLNSELKKYGKMVPLFPVKGWRCTLGGCIGTDAGGFLSAGFGRMHDLLLSLEVVDADGNRLELKRDKSASYPDLEILKAKIGPLTRVAGGSFRGSFGYRLSAFEGEGVDLVDLMAGSEGTLSVFTSATVRIVDRIDGCSCTLAACRSAREAFDLARGAGAGALCAEYLDPAALATFQREAGQGGRIPRGRHGLLLIWKKGEEATAALDGVEATDLGTDPEAVMEKLMNALHRLQRPGQAGRYVVAAEGLEVSPERLPGALTAIEEISRRYALKCLIFGHASEGILYARPLLNLRKEDDRHKLSSFMKELSAAVRAEGGRMASENGIGLQLLPYLQDAMDEQAVTAFSMIKNSFDPAHILGGPRPTEEVQEQTYRFGPEHERKQFRPLLNWNTQDVPSRFDERPLSMIEEVDACHGCGECRTLSFIETQCPVYKTMGSELTSPRGMNNLVRQLSNLGGVPTIALYSEDYTRSIYDYCIECKMCAAECPSHVNTPKIMMEARAQHVKRIGASNIGRASRFFSDYELYTMVASSVARLSNRLIGSTNARSALEHSLGIDRRRRIPEFDLEPFSEWFQQHVSRPGGRGEVAYFSDIYANYFDSRIGRAVVGLLEAGGYSVQFPRQRFTGQPLIHMGMLKEASKYILENISYLYPYAARGIPVICSSPSAVISFRYDYPSVVDDERSRALARTSVDVHEFLHRMLAGPGEELKFGPVAEKIAYHPSCHSRALGTDAEVMELLRMIPGAEVEELQAGCCGAGGSYCFAKETFNLSMEIGRNVFAEAERAMGRGALLVTDGEECALQIEQATGRMPELTLLLLARASGMKLEKATAARKGF